MEATNEMGVIVEFAEHCKEAGWEILEIQAAFPDVKIRNLEDGEIIRAEFEFKSSSFYTHRHNPLECDLIICWEHDWQDCPMPVWVLSSPGWSAVAFVPEMDAKDRKIATLMMDNIYWKDRATMYYAASPQMNLDKYPCGCGRSFGSQPALNAHQRSHKKIAGYSVSFEPIIDGEKKVER
jgi:hypothetical protein